MQLKKNQHFFTDVIICDFAEDFCHWEVEAPDEESGFIFSRVTSQELEETGNPGPEDSHLGTMATYFKNSLISVNLKTGQLYQRFKTNWSFG